MNPWPITLCASWTFNTFIFMSYAASLPVLRPAWGMSGTAAGSISTGFQLGYAVSLLVFSWLADRLGARRVFLWSGWLSAASSIGFAVFARSYLTGLALYTLVALTQGGTYTLPRLGSGAPLAFGAVLDATNAPGVSPTTWGWAFVTLGLGGAAATRCAWGLARARLYSLTLGIDVP